VLQVVPLRQLDAGCSMEVMLRDTKQRNGEVYKRQAASHKSVAAVVVTKATEREVAKYFRLLKGVLPTSDLTRRASRRVQCPC
jgi:hypothetical protein